MRSVSSLSDRSDVSQTDPYHANLRGASQSANETADGQ